MCPLDILWRAGPHGLSCNPVESIFRELWLFFPFHKIGSYWPCSQQITRLGSEPRPLWFQSLCLIHGLLIPNFSTLQIKESSREDDRALRHLAILGVLPDKSRELMGTQHYPTVTLCVGNMKSISSGQRALCGHVGAPGLLQGLETETTSIKKPDLIGVKNRLQSQDPGPDLSSAQAILCVSSRPRSDGVCICPP